MTKISQYPDITTPDVYDLLVGTDVENSNATKNFTIQSIVDLVSAVGTGAQGPQGVQGPAGPLGPVGPAGLNWQGAWVSGTSYVADDAVGYDGASWFCILATSGTTTPDLDITNWALLASQGAQGVQGVQGPTGAQGISGGAGTLQQTVANGNTITDSYNTMTVTAESIKTSNPLGGKVEIVGGISTAKPYLKFGLPSSAGKTVTLTSADSQTSSRTIKLPDADGTIALTSDVNNRLVVETAGPYTLTNADSGGIVIFTASTTLTIPTGLANGFDCTFVTLAGVTLTVVSTGNTLNNATSTTMLPQLSFTLKRMLATNTYIVAGSL